MSQGARVRPKWPELARAVGATIDPARLHPKVVAELRARPENEAIALACSGGADSVAMVLALWSAFPARRDSFLVLHFNHRLRGKAADADERFVRTLARGLGLRCVTGRWTRDTPAKTSEAAARDARMTFFRAAMRDAGAKVLMLGHNRHDVVETMLMRLSRGSGTAGLAAPRPVQTHPDGSVRVRPLLDFRASDIRATLESAGVTWRDDATNAADVFFRNRLRHSVVPALIEASPSDAVAGFAAARAQLEDDDDALHQWLGTIAAPADVRAGNLSALRSRPMALVRRAVHLALNGIAPESDLSRAAVQQLVDAVAAGEDAQVGLPADRMLTLKRSRLSIEGPKRAGVDVPPAWNGEKLRAGHPVIGATGDRVAMRTVANSKALRLRLERREVDPTREAFLAPGDEWSGCFIIRTWRRGDVMRPLGAPGRAKLQDLFVNRKIPRELRHRLPVVTLKSGAIAWIPGFPPAGEFAVQPGAKTVVQLTYTSAAINVARIYTSKDQHV